MTTTDLSVAITWVVPFGILAVSCEASLIVKKDLIERSHRCDH
jgi:hypothetical protein